MRYAFKNLVLILLLCSTVSIYGQIPTITSFSPTSGPVGSAVTITGTNYSTTTANNVVWFGSVKATVTAATATQLTVTVPSGTTFQPVSVTVNGLTGFSKNPFNITFDSPQTFDATAFPSATSFPTAAGPFFIAIGDIDIDGKPDLVVTNNSANTISVLRNTSTSGSITSGSFAAKVDFSTGVQPYGAVISDIDGDGKPDIAVSNYGSSTVSIFRNTSTPGTITSGSLAGKVDIVTSSSPHLLALGDLDGDGKPDMVAVNKFSNTISVYRNISTPGTITTGSFSTKVDFATGTEPYGITLADLDGDGKQDIAVTNTSSNTVSVFRNTTTPGSITSGSFSAKVDFATGSQPMVIVSGDLDMDGKLDLAATNRADNSVSVLKNNCTIGSISVSSFNSKVDFTTGTTSNLLSIGDFNADSKPDLAVSNTGATSVSILRNLGITGSISISSFASRIDVAVGATPYGVAIGDIDGDGKPDLATANLPNNTIAVVRNNISGSGLVAWYPLNGNANDASGNGYNGIVTGATLTTDRFGNPNSAYNFVDNNNINMGNILSDVFAANSYSISIWYNRSVDNNRALLHKWQNCCPNTGNNAFWATPGGFTSDTKGSVYSAGMINNWTHWVATMNSGILKIYVDGVLVMTESGHASLASTMNLMVSATDPYSFNGKIDDIRIYNRVLNSTDVTTLYTENSWPLSAPVRDIDGNTYDTVKIGTQTWMKQNLKTTKYNDGTSIPNVTDNTAWLNLTTPGYCWYDNDENTNKNVYGALYNWYTVNTGKLCPSGWHVPTDYEWKTLEMYLGMSQTEADMVGHSRGTTEGGKLKETGTAHWLTPNSGATNISGFTALGGGYRYGLSPGTSYQINHYGGWWTSTGSESGATERIIFSEESIIERFDMSPKTYGFSVRCLKDGSSSGLVATYPFNGNANDESGNGHNGTVSGATPTDDRFGNADKAFYFNGTNAKISLSQFPTNFENVTISAWANPATLPQNTYAEIFDTWQAAPGTPYRLALNGFTPKSVFTSYETPSGTPRIDYTFNNISEWHYFASVRTKISSGYKLELYVDGVLVKKDSSATAPVLNLGLVTAHIGSIGNGASEFFNGALDDIRIYSRSLTSTEISNLYHENGWPQSAPVIDIEGNTYDTVKIGTQTWMRQNLKTTKYNDGTSIPIVTDNAAWAALSTPAYCWYNNDETASKNIYGALYNWYTVSLENICPSGWRVPSDAEFKILETYLGMSPAELDLSNIQRGTTEGGKLKETGTLHWSSPNTGATNSSGFTALPGSYREETGLFGSALVHGFWWQSEYNSTLSWYRGLNSLGATIFRNTYSKKTGFSVRCLKDDIKSNLVAYFPFNGNANDESGNGNNGTVSGPTLSTDRFGATNNGYNFNSNIITIPDAASINPTSEITISFWEQTSTPAASTPIAKRIYAGDTDYEIYLDDNSVNTITFYYSDISSVPHMFRSSNAINFRDGKWHNISLTYKSGDGTSIKLYFDGIACTGSWIAGNGNGNLVNRSCDLLLGNQASPSPGFFIGNMDDIRIYNRALSASEVEALYHDNGWGFPPTITSFTPSYGSIGSTVIITGTNFDPVPANNIVWFGATKASVITATESELVVTVPSCASYQPISVTTKLNGLTGYSKKPFNVTFPSSQIIDAASFSSPVTLTTASTPQYCAVSDIDGDGKPDLVYGGSAAASKVSIRRNTSTTGSLTTGSFAAGVDLSTGTDTNPIGISVADMDGDGLPDIIAANYNTNTVSVFRNKSSIGAISFDTRVDFGVGVAPHIIEITDIDGDGKPDIAVECWNSASVSVLRNTSIVGSITSGSFASKVDFAVGSGPRGIASADFNGDNKPDLVVTNLSVNTISVLINTSVSGSITASSFAAPVDFPTSTTPVGVSAGDVDGDGKPDIMIGNAGSNSVSVIRNIYTSGTFTTSSMEAKVDYATGTYPMYVFLSDIDGDGKPDMNVVNTTSGSVSVLKNKTSSGTFTAGSFGGKVDFPVGAGAYGLAVNDLDGDGKSDIFTVHNPSNTISILRNQITTPPPTITSFTPTSGPIGTSVTITGTNFSTTPANNIVWFGAVKATVNSATATQLTVIVPTGATYQPITVTVNGLTAYSSKPFNVTFPTSQIIDASAFAPKVGISTGTTPYSTSIGDIDGDGKPDLAVANYHSNTVSIFRSISNSGTINSGSLETKVDFNTGTNPSSVVLTDIDGDGKPDMVITNLSSNTVSVFRNTSSTGSFTSGTFAGKIDFATGTSPFKASVGDIDGDGKPDIALTNQSGNSVSVLRNLSTPGLITTNSFTSKTDISTGTSPCGIFIRDLDGDFKPDLIVANSISNTVSILRNICIPGTIEAGSFAAKVDLITGTSPFDVTSSDIDGDGKPDLAVTNFDNNSLSLFRNLSTAGSITTGSFETKVDFNTGTGPRFISDGDLDGDGKTDLIIGNYTAGSISVLKNTSTSGSISTGSLAIKVDFLTETYPMGFSIGDLDLDGKPDLTIANAGSGTLSIFRNTIPTVVLPPTITSFTPISGAIGTSVTITGTNFSTTPANNIVWFGAVKATVNNSTATSLNVTVPTGTNYQPITVTVNGLTGYSAKPFNVTFTSSKVIDVTSFASKVDFSTASGPFTNILSDVDGDGKSDLIIVNQDGNSFSVYRNSSTSGTISGGSFDTKVDFATGTYPGSIAAGDLDGDGKPDLAVVNTNDNTVSVFRNTSVSGSITSGSYSPRVTFTTGTQPWGVEIGDFDGDGKLDLVVANEQSNTISVFRNISVPGTITTGSFTAKVDFTTGIFPAHIAVIDIDGDSRLDVIVANHNGNSISVFKNTATAGLINSGSFAAKVDFNAGLAPGDVTVGDLDGDNKPDIVASNVNSNSLSIFRNTSTSGVIDAQSFTLKTDFSTGLYPVGVSIGDIDGDGKNDLAVANVNSGNISVFRNQCITGSIGTSSFAPKVDFASGSMPYIVNIGDVDFDGKPDLVVSNYQSNTFSVLRNTIPSVVLPPAISSFTPTSGPIGTSVTITGTNFSTTPANNIVWFGAVKASVNTATSTLLNVNVPTGATYQPITVTVNGLTAYSAKPFDVTFTSPLAIDLTSLSTKLDIPTAFSPDGVAMGDIDGDGKNDLAVTNGTSNTVSVFRNIGASGTITAGSFDSKIDFNTGINPRGIAIGDLDGDGKPDIVTGNNSSSVSVFRNVSSSGIINAGSYETRVDFTTGGGTIEVAIADIDGDGKPDLISTNWSANTISVFRNKSEAGSFTSASFATKVDFATGTSPVSLAVGDIDGDGKPDIIVTNNGSNSFSIFRNISTAGSIEPGSFSPRVDITAQTPWGTIICDIDGDNKLDIIVTNNSSGLISIFRNISTPGSITTGSFSTKVDFPTGNNPDHIAVGDIDGDNKPDIAVSNFGSVSFSLFRNTSIAGSITTASLSQKVDFNVGNNPRGIVIGDLDADTKPDLIVTNVSDNTFSVLRNNIQPVISSPTIGTVTHPTCLVATGSVVLNGLPATGTWTLTRSPGNVIVTGSGTSTTISGLAAGTYTYTVTNSSSITSGPSGDVVINVQPNTPSAPVTGTITHPTCSVATGTVVLNGLPASGTWTITQSPGGTITTGTGISATISSIGAGTYQFTVTNASLCTSAQSADVVINPQANTPSAPTVGTITQPTCSVATGSVELSDLPATGSWTLTRSPDGSTTTGSGTSITINGIAPGSYTYTVTNSSTCVSVQSASIVINAQPVTPSAPAIGTVTQPTCSIATGSVVLNGLPATGTWTLTRSPGGTITTGSGTTTTISGLVSGSYSYTVTNSSGCISASSSATTIAAQPVTPTAPVAGTITHPTCSVATGSVVLSSLPAGTWTLTRSPGGTTTGTGLSTTISDLTAGSYTFTVTNSSSCTSTASSEITINPQPDTPSAPAIGTITQPTCATSTGSVVLSGIPTTGSWVITRSPGGTTTSVTGPNATISGIPAGSHTFTINNAGTCMSLPSSVVVIDAQPVTPSAPAIGTITQPTCTLTTGSVVLSGLPASGTWSLTRSPGGTLTTGTGTTTTISGLTPGTYSFSLSIGTGCTSSSGNVIINNVPIGVIPVIIKKWNDVLICTNLNNKIDKYQWYKGTTPLTGETQEQFYWAKNQPGAYQVLTTDKDGCKNYSNIIQIGSGSKSLTAFPNPVRENVTIDLTDEPTGKAVISIFNEIGVKVLEVETEKEFENLLQELSVETLDEGIYFVRVTIDKLNVYSTKIVVAK